VEDGLFRQSDHITSVANVNNPIIMRYIKTSKVNKYIFFRRLILIITYLLIIVSILITFDSFSTDKKSKNVTFEKIKLKKTITNKYTKEEINEILAN